ncbi:DEAD/DEAH box helicase family protein [Paraburkholderia sp. SARCC-3016]|uniref:DEAD/DEAH box helicase n=1 Tax=Paraburkholderia sp. SARCC-3016 TaxID=3058611 RepID=UPI002809AC80|nr:DEAD/DEAH box helicase family protein [Paraburkholderia sp. SARCC-3016]MDQ7976111.1 DEAD/DEAH box helicase family protein [Paraburkholderia sp. SARCC-3016]
MRFQGFAVDQGLWDALRDGQQESIKTALAFLRGRETAKSCLISLPTGAGKTGVITVVSHLAAQRRVLVISHRRAVKDQLFNEINGRFFGRVAPGRQLQKKTVDHFTEPALKPGIYVTTFQRLSSLPREELEVVKQNVDLLIVDEGHSEPSPMWSQVARGLNAKKIVVTATPYRNDLFAFDIDPEYSYVYTFSQATRHRVLEDPEFERIGVDQLVSRVGKAIESYPKAKCIVKCRRFADIEHYFSLFSRTFKTVAIHDQFAGKTSNENRVSVPADLSDSDWQVIVHQHKLDEGVDIPQAKVLILTYEVGSGRELVQAVGRVVRKFESYPALVLECGSEANRLMWLNFREFDTYLASPEKRDAFLRSLDTAALLKNYLDGFPEVSYFESSFRRKFDLHSIDVKSSLKIPLVSVCFIRKSEGFSLAATTDRLMWDSDRHGELVDVRHDQYGMNVILAVCFKNSRFLDEHLFFEPSLEVTILREFDNFVAVFDSRSRDFTGVADYRLGSAISVNSLLTLAARAHITRTKEAHAAAISTSTRRPERTSISGRNLESIGSGQGNSAYALTTVKVDNIDEEGERQSGYYLGVGSGRVSDQMKRNFSLEELDYWMQDVATVIEEPPENRSVLLGSYAKPIHQQPTIPPASAIIDLSSLNAPLRLRWNNRNTVIENTFKYAEYNDGFAFVDGFPDLKFGLDYDEEGRALLISDEDVRYFSGDVEAVGSFLDLISRASLKVLYPDGTSYFDGSFYQVTLPSDTGFELDQSKLSGAIIGVQELLSRGLTEKDEDATTADEFGENSVFSLIDKLKAVANPNAKVADHGPFFPYIADLDLMLCTDMGTEPADFILSSPTKLVFAHVKCGTSGQRPRSPAGALAEVGSQAIKNIEMLTSTNRNLKPGNWPRMPDPWPTPTSGRTLLERIRIVNGRRLQNPGNDEQIRMQSLREAWSTIADRRVAPSVSKEIWIIVGNSFSRRNFERQMRRGNDASSESLQAFQLIDSWQSTAANNDVALKIFVST